jgi:hypothetical protein
LTDINMFVARKDFHDGQSTTSTSLFRVEVSPSRGRELSVKLPEPNSIRLDCVRKIRLKKTALVLIEVHLRQRHATDIYKCCRPLPSPSGVIKEPVRNTKNNFLASRKKEGSFRRPLLSRNVCHKGQSVTSATPPKAQGISAPE